MIKKLFKSVPILVAALFFICADAKSQITGISVDSIGVWFPSSQCILPVNSNINASGRVTGTTAPNDSVTLHIFYGDGNDSIKKVMLGQGWFWYNGLHTYQIAGTFTVMIVATTPNSLSDTIYSNPFTLSNTCAPLAGKLFIDANNNCVYNTGELELSYRTVVAKNTSTNVNHYAFTDANGNYNMGLPPGNYDITPTIASSALASTCPSSGTKNITVTTGNTYTENFVYSCSSTATNTDVIVTGYASTWRPGFTRPLSLHVTSNSPCFNTPGTLTATLPPMLSYSSTWYGSTPTTVAGNVLTWNVSSLSSVNDFHSTLSILCATNATLNDTFCVAAVFTPTTPDSFAGNNSANICGFVSNSYDPNDKAVFPKGNGANGAIANGTPLSYHINFQNTGNDTAYTVTVKDEIDTDLNLSTFQLLETSHPVKVSIVGREISFRFDNIHLPDSNTNEPLSHGFITYAIKPNASLSNGTVLNNTAHIYFDYNDPIITNTTLNTILLSLGVQYIGKDQFTASIYPNPAKEQVFIKVNGNQSFKALMMDMTGRTVGYSESNTGAVTMPTHHLSSGNYFIKLTDAQNNVISTKIVVQQ